MPRWKALPDELDPQIREFTSQLRRLVDRSGLSVAALADRTGYSKTSWERYLGGRLLAPKGAIVALAEVTGTNPIHLTTMWELAERAWSRSEMRHDMTMEAIRISQARAALSEFGPPPANAKGRTARRGGSATAVPGIAGPAGVAPTVPPQPTAADADSRTPAANSWNMAGYTGPSPASGRRTGAAGVAGPAGAAGGAGASGTGGGAGAGGRGSGRRRAAAPAPAGGGKRRMTMFAVGLVGVLVVAAGAVYLGGRGDGEGDTKASPSPSVTTGAELPPGVKCSGDSCTGKDAESMGCSGDLVTTAQTATVGTTVVEVRYSKVCAAAWGRITQAAQGDKVEVSAGKARENGSITLAGDTVAYTPMVAVKDAGEAIACATLASGGKGCTQQP
ncbi:XRE family transcriptional regulator [Streptomyces sp. JB150]|uniref:helix-turn-helix domain-containing protein n=1 Tax=Streptomyces sp. JB150 TaxID=2714844 RepID=UPI00140CC3D0|nr:XRE family transcriptional regulator [Streptomyces sp. JB150]QIJ64311.1 XRE family transcriptional regulator [Streptomyces sp. JB150]